MTNSERKTRERASSHAYYLRNKVKVIAAGAFRKRRSRLENPEEERAKDRARYAKDPERKRIANRRSYHRHIEARRAEVRAYRVAHIEELKARARERQRATLPSFRAWGAARHARKMLAMPPWADRVALREKYTIAAQATARTGLKHVVDHFYPLRPRNAAFSGLHVPWNLRVMIEQANSIKNNLVTPNMLRTAYA